MLPLLALYFYLGKHTQSAIKQPFEVKIFAKNDYQTFSLPKAPT